MRALLVADLHIKLGQKNVPKEWQKARFLQLANELNKESKDLIIIAGDLLDVPNPSVEEVGLMYDFLSILKGQKIIIPGNHEMVTKTKDCYLSLENMLNQTNTEVIREFTSIYGFDFIPYNILFKKNWGTPKNKIAITHVRGSIPPHVIPEISLDRFETYDKVFAGDLHSVKNSQGNIFYPGSPFAISFHRNFPSGAHGFYIIDSDSLDHFWTELHLPQLIRRKISDPSLMVKDKKHHIIYEIEGSLEDLAKIKKSDLLDKKVTLDISKPATLELNGRISDELAIYLTKIKNLSVDSVERIVSRFQGIFKNDDKNQ